jgi:hypothetical protein
MKTLFRAFTLAAAIAASPAMAAISVDSLNFPVWVERGARMESLAPGDRLDAGDIVNTGKTGRVWLEAEDGSVIKLGQGARFVVDRDRLDTSADETIYDAAFRVLRGAFRFTGSFFPRRQELPHRVDFQVGAITAGVRGTDIWGSSGEDEDFVALLEGRIEVRSQSDTAQLMDQPLTLYRKQKQLPADKVSPISMSVVGELAMQTELSVEAGIAARDGAYELVLASVAGAAFDPGSLDRFRRAGYPVEAVSAEIGGDPYMLIVLRGLVDRQAAENLRRRVAAEFALDDAWINKRI